MNLFTRLFRPDAEHDWCGPPKRGGWSPSYMALSFAFSVAAVVIVLVGWLA